jgi:tetrapyrrole methylase family protein/MazG family protein
MFPFKSWTGSGKKQKILTTKIVKIKDLLSEIISNIYSFAESIHTDPEESLRQTNLRFKKRFLYIEETIKRQKRNIKDVSLQELDRLWEEAKDFDHKNRKNR